MNIVTIKQFPEKVKPKNHALTNHLVQRSCFLICKDGPDDVDNFTKIFTHILKFAFYGLYYILKIFLINYSITAWLQFTNNNLDRGNS